MTSHPESAHIRPMTTADLEAVEALANALPAAPHWPRAAYRIALDSAAPVRRIALVAECAGQFAGFAIAGIVAQEAEIETIAVASHAQRQGIGRQLLHSLLAAASREGAREAILELRSSNLPAAGLYASAGFRESGRRRGYYRDPVEDALLLRLPL